jgi:pimeloyl-ACP methyl ester carboxylesterase
MSAPTLVFSHANGFPAGTYRVLFDLWRAAGWRVEAVDKFGHDPRWPVSSNWPRLIEELVHRIEAANAGAPVVLVGHSLGGFLSLLTACRRPDLARAVVMLDSPVIAGWRAHSLRVAKATRLIHRVSPGRIAARRRHHWPSAQACHDHFASKTLFARWDPRVLADYVAAGTEPHADDGGGGVRLAFDREIERRIYDTLPHHLPEVLRTHPLRCPLGFVGGTRSREIRQVGLTATRRLAHGHLRMIEGGHLFPMERPEEAATAVLELIAEITG